MSLALYINYKNQYTGLARCDLYADEGVILKRQILSETGLDNTNRQFTRAFNIPATPTNNELLKHWELKSNESIVNPNKAIPARIEIKDIYVITGNIELLSVTWKSRQPESYRLVFYGDTSSFKAELGETMLDDIDWSAFGFVWSQGAVTNSWNTGTTNYYIPIISFKRWFKWYASPAVPDPDPEDIAIEEYGVLLNELRVGLKLKDMIETIGAHIGKTIILDHKIDKVLLETFVIPSKFENQALTFAPEQFRTEVTNSATILIPTTPPSGPPAGTEIIHMDTIIDDPKNRWDGTSIYTAEFSGIYTFELVVIGSVNSQYDIWLYDSTNTAIASDSTGNVIAGNPAVMTLTAGLTAAATYYFVWRCSQSNNNGLPTMKTLIVPASIIGSTYDPAENMPVKKAADFLSEFLTAFNLLIYETNLNEFTISDIKELFASNTEFVDLEDYVDEQSLTYEKITVYDRINFKHKTGKDAPNILHFDVKGKQYGELDYLPDVDYSKGTLKQENIFTVFPPAYIRTYSTAGNAIGRTDLWHHYQLSNDNPPKPVLADFLLMYRNAPVATTYEWWLQFGINPDGSPSFTRQSFWGRYSQVHDSVSVKESTALTYSLESPFVGVPAEGTIVNLFWLDWLVQLYKRTAYTLTLSFPANFGIYLKLNALSVVFLNGFYHFMASTEYNSSTNILKLKLLRTDKIISEVVTEENGILKIKNI